jgi:hypothetical protein
MWLWSFFKAEWQLMNFVEMGYVFLILIYLKIYDIIDTN